MLLYRLEQAPMEKTILKECIRSGMPVPERIQNAPDLLDGLTIYFEAFISLTRFRQVATGECPISWESINAYCNQYSVEDDQRDLMFEYISEMDAVYLDFRTKKNGAS